MSEKLRVGIFRCYRNGRTEIYSLLENHPWFEVVTVAASLRSAGKTYEEAVGRQMENGYPNAGGC